MTQSESGKSALGCSAEDSLDRQCSEESAAGICHGRLRLRAVQEPDDHADGRGGGGGGEMTFWAARPSGEEAGKAGRGQTRRCGSQRENLDFMPGKGQSCI